ncbi:aldose 1-epimerase family protein [Nocardioides deserti]|uniref:Aldose 1-epimerase family protein n=1 Tax=Nocardioides deserti TaxID=1588644 RepID=A0ABR6U5U5_9ACTN|nr:aldose 1-epimerase family protein [Nocardioides deserti]MBC2959809.1 aldose 1-epimerase family protein [Nocardioides deserti]GGO75785.1 aldose 1-epimerase [Nocardioides deserti]
MLPPSGEQFEIEGGGYRAVVTESGAALRALSFRGRDLVDGFGEDEMSSGGRGQLLVPWPNRVRDGQYAFEGRDLQLPLTEPSRHNSSHGLARWVAWSVEEHTGHSVSLTYRLMAQTGYPWTLDLHVAYDLSADGLTVTQTATNDSGRPAPYASGAHPYLRVGDGPVDRWELTLPAATRLLVDDERLLPVGREAVEGTPYDFRVARPLRDLALNHCFTDLERDPEGNTTAVLRDPASGDGVTLWVDGHHPWLLLYTADDVPATARRSLAVEPMTAPPDALRSGEDLFTLAPDETVSVVWGIRALED